MRIKTVILIMIFVLFASSSWWFIDLLQLQTTKGDNYTYSNLVEDPSLPNNVSSTNNSERGNIEADALSIAKSADPLTYDHLSQVVHDLTGYLG